MKNPGRLFIVATPIGNLEDITIRAIKTLLTAPAIACEDTRRTGQLLKYLKDTYTEKLNISYFGKPQLVSFYDEIEEMKVPILLKILKEGNDVALVSDSGTPLISDPGYRLIQVCIKNKIKIVPIPGVSSVIASISTAGLPTDSFIFIGYPPRSENKQIKKFLQIQKILKNSLLKPTIIMFEVPHRLIQTLSSLEKVFGDCNIVILRELTKIHEEFFRGRISEAKIHFENPQGEFVILMGRKII